MKMYPPRILTPLAVATLLSTGAGAWAQGGATPTPSPAASTTPAEQTAKPMHRSGGDMRSGNMLERLTKELDLTADQQTKIKAILDAQQEKMKAERGKPSGESREQLMKQRRESREAMNKEIEAVLTPEQKAKYEATRAKLREHLRSNGGGMQRGPGRGEDKAPATAPSPAASATP